MAGFLKVVQSLALLLARIGLGGILILHGWRRYHDQGMASQVAYLHTFATPYANYAAWGGTAVEVVGGLFLILGLLTPVAAAAVVAEQVLVIAYTSWYKGWSLTDVHGTQVTWAGGWEYNVIIGVLALLLVTHGSGAVGIDRLFRRQPTDDAEEVAAEPQPRQRLERRNDLGTGYPSTSSSPSTSASTPPRTGSNTDSNEAVSDTLIRTR